MARNKVIAKSATKKAVTKTTKKTVSKRVTQKRAGSSAKVATKLDKGVTRLKVQPDYFDLMAVVRTAGGSDSMALFERRRTIYPLETRKCTR